MSSVRSYQLGRSAEGSRDFVRLAGKPYRSHTGCDEKKRGRNDGQDGVLEEQGEVELPERTIIARTEQGI
jgi:hypothetical protein